MAIGIGAIELAIVAGVVLLALVGVIAVVASMSSGGRKPPDEPQ